MHQVVAVINVERKKVVYGIDAKGKSFKACLNDKSLQSSTFSQLPRNMYQSLCSINRLKELPVPLQHRVCLH